MKRNNHLSTLILILLFHLFFSSGLLWSKIIKNDNELSFKPYGKNEIRYCIKYRNTFPSFLSSGRVYKKNTNQLIAQAENGCFTVKRADCLQLRTLTFYPDSLVKFKYSLDLTISKNGQNCYINKNPYFATFAIGKSIYDELSSLSLSIPYLENVSVNNRKLSQHIKGQVTNCHPQDYRTVQQRNSCLVFNTYKYVVENFRYIKDPVKAFSKEDSIYSSEVTIRRGGGDCEDLSGLLLSYLVNQGVDSYMVLTDDHIYGMACNVDQKTMKNLVEQSFEREEVKSYQQVLGPGEYFSYANFSGHRFGLKMKLEISSSQDIDVYLTPSIREFEKFKYGKPMQYLEKCSKKGVYSFVSECEVPAQAALIIGSSPEQKKSTTVKIKITYKYNELHLQNKVVLRYYSVNGKRCVVLEPTAGKNGYPGYSVDNARRKLAFNPQTWEWKRLK